MQVHNLTRGLVDMVYPRVCCICSNSLGGSEEYLCLNCVHDLPVNEFPRHHMNPVEMAFWGRIPIQQAYSFLTFSKQGKAQKIIHAIKYHKLPGLAQLTGNLFGKELIRQNRLHNVDAIIPIPLHQRKLKSRGFNQSEELGMGISKVTGIPLELDVLKRTVFSDTQTRKSRIDRWLNVEHIFEVQKKLTSKHYLLLDDVITTGATIESAGQHLISAGAKLSVASIAYAGKQV